MFADNPQLVKTTNNRHDCDIIKNRNRYLVIVTLNDLKYYELLIERFKIAIDKKRMKYINVFVNTHSVRLLTFFQFNDKYCFSFSFGASKDKILNILENNNINISYVAYDNNLISIELTLYEKLPTIIN